MPYVNSKGEVVNNEPFMKSLYKFIIEIYIAIGLFFRTLLSPIIGGSVVDPDQQSRFRDSLRDRRGGGYGGGGGGGGGGGFGPGRPGGGGRRPIGRLNTTTTNIPSCASGGCCGG